MNPTARRLQLVGWEAETTRENGFSDFLIGCGLAPETTVRNYLLRYRQALAWCDKNGQNIDTMTATDIAAMMRGIPRTQYSRIGQIRAMFTRYYTWIERDNPPLAAVRLPPQPHYPNRALHPDDARLIAKAAAGDHPKGLAVEFGLYMALRVSEIASVQWSRFNHDRTIYTVTGKRSETYTLPVHPRLQEALAQLVPTCDYVFPGSAGRAHVGASTVWAWSDRIAENAGIGRLGGCHVLRHTCLTRLYEQTRDLYLVQRFARHKDPKQTAHYVMQDFGSLQSAVVHMGY